MIDWLIAERGGLPPAGTFLAPPEQERYIGLRVQKRRQDWLLGRWAAKRLVRRHMARRGLDLPLTAVMVLSDPDGAPRLAAWGLAMASPQISAELERLQISLSHSADRALCAMTSSGPSAIGHLQPTMTLGADIEQVAARGMGFAEAYYTERELALLAATPHERYDALSTAVWSAKEATLKLTRHGLRVDTRAVTCLPAPLIIGGWAAVTISTHLTRVPLLGWWRELDGCVITIAAPVSRGERPSGAHMSDWETFGEGEVTPFFALSE